jgi:hypothetical protein
MSGGFNRCALLIASYGEIPDFSEKSGIWISRDF